MILQKRLDYGFNGYQVPQMLRGPRSARRRRSFKNKFDDSQLCAFDLLATVAGKLLVEGEIPNCSGNKSNRNETGEKKQYLEEMSPKSKPCEKEVYKRPFFLHDPVLKVPIVNNTVKDASVGYILEDETKRNVKMEPPSFTGQVSVSHNMGMFSPVHPVALDNSAKVPCSYDNDDDENLVSRDDDEKISWCSKPSTTVNKDTRLLPRIADRRIRKILASKCWKITKRIDEKVKGQHFLADGKMKAAYPQEESCYNCQRSVRDYPFKKRKLYGRSYLSSSNMGPTCQNNMPSLAVQGYNGDARGIESTKNGATGTSAIAVSQHASQKSRDSHVKLKIKSFRIPELFVEIPETATVGSLKKTVMDAVTAILSGGLRVGVLVQGKRIRDDSKTLLQTGISHDNKILDALNFVLEPSRLPEDRSLILPSQTPQPLPRYPCGPSIVRQGTGGTLTEVDGDSVPLPRTLPTASADKCLTKSKASVSPPLTVDALVRKPKRSDVSQQQRRIRRPFSVSEVEALVQAVEKLGTGRWRDVKLRAFDNAKQRTYVDLKDKWKTLVHTARISPQQRRGEPVPQELLDRVLTAHAYWSQNLPKHHHHHHIKHHS